MFFFNCEDFIKDPKVFVCFLGHSKKFLTSIIKQDGKFQYCQQSCLKNLLRGQKMISNKDLDNWTQNDPTLFGY